MSKTSMYVIVAVIVIIIVVGGILAYMFTRPSGGGGGNTMDIYATEYKFSTSSSLSPANPTLTFTAGQTVTVTLHNMGIMPHNWAIVTAKTDGNTNLAFSGAQIASASNAVQGGSTGSATFTVGSAGTYYYICQTDGHVSLGMAGTVIVNP
jgi:plastocyanin